MSEVKKLFGYWAALTPVFLCSRIQSMNLVSDIYEDWDRGEDLRALLFLPDCRIPIRASGTGYTVMED